MRKVTELKLIALIAIAMLGSVAYAAERTWIYEARGSRDPGVVRVEDPDALNGSALVCPPSETTHTDRYTFQTGSITDLPPGEYEARYRLKVDDNTVRDTVFSLGVQGPWVGGAARGIDFKQPGEYQEVVVPFTIEQRGMVNLTIRKHAGPQAWIDRVTVVQKHAFTETDQLAFAEFERPDELWLIPHEGINVWFVKGLYYQHYGIHNVLEEMHAEIDVAYFVRTRINTLEGVPLEGMPAEVKPPESPELSLNGDVVENIGEELLADLIAAEREDAKRYGNDAYNTVMARDLIVLANIHADCLTIPQRAMIHDFVKAGGGLLIIGGPFAFGRGAMADSELLEALLPLKTSGEYDLQPLQQPTPLQTEDRGRISFEALSWADRPMVMWMHLAAPKPGATVELTVGGRPALVTWEYGRGRVAALTATVLGEPADGQTAFWRWKDWQELMDNVVRWLLPPNS